MSKFFADNNNAYSGLDQSLAILSTFDHDGFGDS